jgi:hypothetical protein
MKKIQDVKDLYDNAKSMLDELLKGDFDLHGIDPKEIEEHNKFRQERMDKFKKLKETVDQTSRLLEEIQQAPQLKKVDEQELKQHQEEKENAIEKLKSFSLILEEITSTNPIESLEKVDQKELKNMKEERKQRLKVLNEANFHLNQFGSILEEIAGKEIKLNPVDKQVLKELEKDKKERMKDINKIKTKMELILSLVEDISKEIKPDMSEKEKMELLEKFEISNFYLKKISKNKTEKLEKLTGIDEKLFRVGQIFNEMQGKSLKPIAEEVKKEFEQEKLKRAEEISGIQSSIKAKFDISNQLLKEIQEAPGLEQITDEELQEYEAERFQRRSRIQVLKNHLDVAEDLLKTVSNEIPLKKINEEDLIEYQNAKNERLDKLSNVKYKLDVLEEMMNNIGKGVTLFKIDPKELEEYEQEKLKRLQDIENLKNKLREFEILKD